tara:strand:+ start:253 stop:1362 length:1110 start_codon:yes stop_codon:yes gene_type:complete
MALEINNEKEELDLELNSDPDLIVADNDFIGAELLINTSKSGNEESSVENTSNESEVNLFDKDTTDIQEDPLIKKVDTNTNSNNVSNDSEYTPIHMMNQNDIKNEKIDLIYKFKKLENQGIDTTMNYNMNSSLDDMRNEYIKLKKQRELENSVKFQRKMLMAIITAIEFLNGRFDPFDIKLNGWSESVNENINDYDEIFEELHAKYGGGTDMAPEIRLILMLGGSAFMFHLTNTMLKSSMPSIDKLFSQNPDLMNQFANSARGGPSAKQPEKQGNPGMPPGLDGMMSNMMGSMMGGLMGGGIPGMGGGIPGMGSEIPKQRPPPKQKMSGPENIDDIVNDMKIDDLDLDDISIASTETDNSKKDGISLDI